MHDQPIPSEHTDEIRREIAATRERIADAAAAVSETLGDVALAARPQIADARDALACALENAGPQIAAASDALAEPKALVRGAAGYAARYPLGVALGSLATGFLLGLAFPRRAEPPRDAAA
jgi:hypothetical protein